MFDDLKQHNDWVETEKKELASYDERFYLNQAFPYETYLKSLIMRATYYDYKYTNGCYQDWLRTTNAIQGHDVHGGKIYELSCHM